MTIKIIILIIYCFFFFVFNIIYITSLNININALDFSYAYPVLIEGNPTDSSGGQWGSTHRDLSGLGNSSSSGAPSGSGGSPGTNNNLVPISQSNNPDNQNENQQVNYYTEKEQDKLLKECMAKKLINHRLANAHTADVYLNDTFTSAEHEYIADKIYEERAARVSNHGAKVYTDNVVGVCPDRRFIGKVTINFIERVFK